jgi:hypothetical protein
MGTDGLDGGWVPSRQSTLVAIRAWMAAYAAPLQIFIVTRAGLCLLAYLSLIFLPVPSAGLERGFPNNLFLDGWTRWDAAWYRDIAEQGYSNIPKHEGVQRDTAFFPLYPVLIKAANLVFKKSYISGLFISNLTFLIAILLLFNLVERFYGIEVAKRSILLLSVYPFSFYFIAVYTESLFLLAVVCAFYFGEKRLWFLGGMSAAAAGATRVVGGITMVALLILYLEHIDFDWRKIRPNILWILLGAIGPGGYMLFLAMRFGSALQFVRSQSVAGWGADMGWEQVIKVVQDAWSLQALSSGQYQAIYFINLLVFPIAIVLALLAWRLPRKAYGVWSVLTILASFSLWRSMGRFTAVVFPLFIVAALLVRTDRWFQSIAYVSILLLSLFTIMFVHWYWVG